MLHDGHHYDISRASSNQLSVSDSTGEVIGIITLDHDTENASVLSFYDDGSEESQSVPYYEVYELSDTDLARIVITYSC